MVFHSAVFTGRIYARLRWLLHCERRIVTEVCLSDVGALEVRIVEICACEINFDQFRIITVGTFKICTFNRCIRQNLISSRL